jgi:hypothetical protein
MAYEGNDPSFWTRFQASETWYDLKGFFRKLLENLSSAKMAMFFIPMAGSLIFLKMLFDYYVKMVEVVVLHPELAEKLGPLYEILTSSFGTWCTFTVSLTGVVIVVRESFKIAKIRRMKETDKVDKINV